MVCNYSYGYDARDDSVNAWELQIYYSGYEAPKPVTDCSDVEVGDLVEFNQGNERMWAKVVDIWLCPLCCDFIVEVTSELKLFHPFKTGDRILINIVNIYNLVSA